MARLNTALNVEEIDRSADAPRELLPDGDFLMELSAIDQKIDGDNIAHSYTYRIVEPTEFEGRLVWDWIDLQNDLEWKQKKGQARLGNLCDSIGYDPISEGLLEDDEVLMFRVFMAKVVREAGGVSKAGKEFKPKNVVSRFYKPTDKDAPAAASIYENQPTLRETPAPKAANDNRAPAANDNRRQESQPAQRAAGRPWGQKK